jgi:hypothetical protein
VRQRLLNKTLTACFLKCLTVVAFITITNFTSSGQVKSNTKTTFITRFPFTLLSGGIIILRATLDDFPDTLNFILDTGSGGISLDSAVVESLHLVKTPTERLLRGIAMMRKITYVTNRTLHFTDLNVEHLDFHINDYDLLTSVYGVKIDGIIGYSFFSRYIVKIDYDKSMVEVWSQGTIKYPRSGMVIKPAISGIPVFNATVIDGNSVESRVFFYYGAG